MSVRIPLIIRLILAVASIPSLVRAGAPAGGFHHDGDPIADAPGSRSTPIAISDGETGMIVVWSDGRFGAGTHELFAQRVLSSGQAAPGWPAGGVRLSTSGRAGTPVVLPAFSTNFGAVVVWPDSALPSAMRVQRVFANGALPAGADPAGRVASAEFGGPSGLVFSVTRSPNRVLLMYNKFGEDGSGFFGEQLQLQALDEEGRPQPGWIDPLEVARLPGLQRFSSANVIGTLSDEAVVTYGAHSTLSDPLPDEAYAEHLVGSVPAVPQDFTLLNDVLQQSTIAAIEMVPGALDNNAFVRLPDATLNRLDRHNRPVWPLDPAVHLPGRLVPDGEGGLFALDTSGPQPVLRHVTGSGATAPGWTPLGVTIPASVDAAAGFDARAIERGLMFAWVEPGLARLRVTFVTQTGAFGPGWPAGGLVVAGPGSGKRQPALVPVGSTGALLAWTDDRRHHQDDVFTNFVSVTDRGSNGRGGDIAGRAIAGQGQHGSSLRFVSGSSSRGTTVLDGRLAGPGDATLEVLDINGRRVARETVATGGGAFRATVRTAGLARGIYWARLTHGEDVATTRLVLLN